MSKLVFITRHNAKRLITNEFKQQVHEKIDTQGRFPWDIPFFSRFELAELFGLGMLFKDPQDFISTYGGYVKIDTQDTMRFVEPESLPAYHIFFDCELLHNDYNKPIIPEAIRELGNSAIMDFRDFWRNNRFILNEKDGKAKFELRFMAKYGVKVEMQNLEVKNSGTVLFENYNNLDIDAIPVEMDLLYSKLRSYFKDHPDKRTLLGLASPKLYSKDGFPNNMENKTGLSKEDLNSFASFYFHTFKKPAWELAVRFLQLKYSNPNLQIENTLLDSLNFKCCKNCLERSQTEGN